MSYDQDIKETVERLHERYVGGETRGVAEHPSRPLTKAQRRMVNAINKDHQLGRRAMEVVIKCVENGGIVRAAHITGNITDSYRQTRRLLKDMLRWGILERVNQLKPMRTKLWPGRKDIVIHVPEKGWEYEYQLVPQRSV